jgi:uncharacterized membrane protein YhaH (DUF805 family)
VIQREELGVVLCRISAVFGEMAVGNVLALQTKLAKEVVDQVSSRGDSEFWVWGMLWLVVLVLLLIAQVLTLLMVYLTTITTAYITKMMIHLLQIAKQ